MSPEPEREATSRNRLPFEPTKSRKKPPAESKEQPDSKPAPKKAVVKSTPSPQPAKLEKPQAPKSEQKSEPKTERKRTPISQEDRAIPQAVSDRMVRRMALFSGIPTALGMLTFIASYGIITFTEFELPNIAVVLTSMGCFGLGVLGLSYGAISASWEPNTPGTKSGWQEFKTNFGRLTSAWRSVKKDS